MASKNLCTYVAAACLFLGGVGYLVYSGLSENSVYFLNVAEAQALPVEKLSNIRLFGTVAAAGIEQPESGLGVAFNLEDKDDQKKTIHISYAGVVPDTFKEGAEVIVEGSMKTEGGFFAKSLMTKCPSKYQKQNRKG